MEREVIEMQREVGATAGSVWMRDDDDENLLYPYIFLGSHSKELENMEVPIDTGFCGYCVRHKVELISNDMSKEEKWNSNVDKRTGFHTENMICLPIVVYDECIGCVQLLNKPGGFNERDVQICHEIVAFIIDNL